MPELRIITREIDDEDRLHIEYGGIAECEPADAAWYHVTPAEELIDTLTRFFAKVIEQRNATPALTAREYAEATLTKLCWRLDLTDMILVDLPICVSETLGEIEDQEGGVTNA
jgi:hypothetical protein